MEGVSDLSFEDEENICAVFNNQPVIKRIGLGQTENVMFSLSGPGYLQ